MPSVLTPSLPPEILHYDDLAKKPINETFFDNLKGVRATNLNYVTYFLTKPDDYIDEDDDENENEKIVCRHISYQYLTDIYNNGKIDINNYATSEALQKHVLWETEQKQDALRLLSPEKYLINNDEFGQYLAVLFKTLEERKIEHGLYYMMSENHAMAIHLKCIYDKIDNTQYSVVFYDPNKTTRPLTFLTNNPDDLRGLSVKSFLPADAYQAYYEEMQYSTLTGYQDIDLLKETPHYPFFRQFRDLPEVANSKAKFYFLAVHNNYGELKKSVDEELALLNKPDNNYSEWCLRINEMLTSKSEDLHSPLRLAFYNEYNDTVLQFIRLMKKLPQDMIFNHFVNKGNETSFLKLAYINGDADVVAAVLSLMENLDGKQLREVLQSTTDDNMSFFLSKPDDDLSIINKTVKLATKLESSDDILQFLCLPTNRYTTMLAFICEQDDPKYLALIEKLLNRLNSEQLFILFSHRVFGGRTPLWTISLYRNVEALKGLMPWLMRLTSAQRLELLQFIDQSPISERTSLFYDVSMEIKGLMISELAQLTSDFTSDQAIELLLACPIKENSAQNDSAKISALANMINRGFSRTLSALIPILQIVEEKERYALLAAVDEEGKPAIFELLHQKKMNAVEAFIPLLDLLTQPQRQQLLSARDKMGRLYLAKIIQSEKTETYFTQRCYELLNTLSSPYREPIEASIRHQLAIS